MLRNRREFKLKIEENGFELVSGETHKAIQRGDVRRDLKGRSHVVVSGVAPNSPLQVGRVINDAGEILYPAALDLFWVKTLSQTSDDEGKPCPI